MPVQHDQGDCSLLRTKQFDPHQHFKQTVPDTSCCQITTLTVQSVRSKASTLTLKCKKKKRLVKLPAETRLCVFNCIQACSVCMSFLPFSVFRCACLGLCTEVCLSLNVVLCLFVCIHSSFCWKRQGSASLTVTPELFREPGGNTRPARSMSRWEKKVSKGTFYITFVVPVCPSLSLTLFLLCGFVQPLTCYWTGRRGDDTASTETL